MRWWWWILTLAWSLSAAVVAARQEAPFEGEERVTAVDLLVKMAGRPRLGELEAVVDGVSRPVVAVEPPGSEEPWRVVLYFDTTLSDETQVRWAAEIFAQQLDRLRELGEVELVVADPEPRTVVSPEADAGAIEEALGRLALLPTAEDALVERRLKVLDELEEIGLADLPAGAGAAVVADETALVQERLDALLLALVERSRGAPPRRLVLLATGGFDLEPDWLPSELPAPPSPFPEAVELLCRTLAAYGWLAAPLLAPPPSGTIPGVRIGIWRFSSPVASLRSLPGLLLLHATREEDRDPELADAYLELAEARQRQGELDGAADAARQALVHYAEDPRTADRQSRTLVLLGQVYRDSGEEQKARNALRRAARRDPQALAGHPVLAALPAAPEAALGVLAGATGSSLIRSEQDLLGALAALDHWRVVTVQLPGLPDRELHEVEIRRTASGVVLDGPGWLRFGTPRSVADARSRSRGAGRGR
jgi:tetratricopeptide (TPR) repeat protein